MGDGRFEVREWAETDGAPPSKEVLDPDSAVMVAMANPGRMVTYSRGHTQGSARTKAKRIRKGQPHVWDKYVGSIQTKALREMDGTYSVCIRWLDVQEA